MTVTTQTIHERAINTIRALAMDAVQAANSGHPGTPMALAPLAYVLWTRVMRYNPKNAEWFNRDRFILSAGHASMLQYAILHLTGYDEFPRDQIKHFRQWGSNTPGHPESELTSGIEVTTGPLGQGFGNAVGMAIAERWLATHFNRPGHDVIDHRTYVIASDGDMMEGISHEAGSLAGHLGLGKLIVFYDSNSITIDGSTDLAFSEDVGLRFEAYKWHVQHVADANDLEAIENAARAAAAVTDQPSLIVVRSHIGYGSPNKQDTSAAHGTALGEEEVRLTKQNLGIPTEPLFHVADEVYEHFDPLAQRGAQLEQEWDERVAGYTTDHPEMAGELLRAVAGKLPEDWNADIPMYEPQESGPATRVASGAALNAIAARVPNLIGGSADLAASNNTDIKDAESFSKKNYSGRILHFGVREHVMGAALTGMNLHGGVRAFGATFLVFSDYMRNSIRLAAMQHAPSIYIFTHDSIGLGEDGPTHQPIEHLASLRAIPRLITIRPADANETSRAWEVAMQQTTRPVALSLTRQGLPILPGTHRPSSEGVGRGGYVVSDCDGQPQALIIATGSEVSIAVDAQQRLADAGIATRVISLPSRELFDEQSDEYKASVLPAEVSARVTVEAAATLGWRQYAGPRGVIIGIDRFGASAPYKTIYEHLGITAEHVQEEVRNLLQR
jgi:transketolase